MSKLDTKMRQLKRIKNGQGLQHILDEVYAIMGNPALIFDMDYQLIASPTGAVNDDPIWCEFMAHGKLHDETIEFFKKESFIDSVANCTQFDGVTYLFSRKLKYNRIFGQIYNKDQMPVADLVMVACESPFEDYTPALIKTVCAVLSAEIGEMAYYERYGQIYQDNMIEKLIEGSIDDKEIYSGHVSNIERGLKANIFVAVADVTQAAAQDKDLAYFRALFKQAEPAFKYAVYAEYIVILISSHNSMLNRQLDLNSLAALCERENICVGVSSCFENLFEMHKYYLEAIDALHDEKQRAAGQKIKIYDENRM